jgi:hypothetical protein
LKIFNLTKFFIVTKVYYKHFRGVGALREILGEGVSEVAQGFATVVAGFGGVYGAI